MNKAYLIAAASLGLLATAPAQAQLLGGGGLGGQLGGTLSGAGTLSGPSGPLRDLPTETLRSSTRGSGRGSAATAGSQRVDRRQGSVAVDRSLEGNLDAAGAQIIDTPAGSGSAAGSANGRAAGSGNASAQLVGTDAVRDVAGRAVGRTRGAVATVGESANGLAGRARAIPGSASAAATGAGGASGQGGGSLGSGMLAAAGSGAAAGEGAFAIAPGTPIVAPDGSRIGRVRQIVSDSRGRVESVVVRARGREFTVPAASLSGSGQGLVMTESAAEAGKTDQGGRTSQPAN